MSNFTRNEKTLEESVCSTNPDDKPAVIFLSAFNFLFSIVASIGNILILIALQKPSTSLHPPSKVLLRCLATSDLCVGIILQPLVAIVFVSVANENWTLCGPILGISYLLGVVLFGVSLLTLTAVSVERLLALLLGLRFRQVVTVRRTVAVTVCFWVINFAIAAWCVWNYLVFLWYGFVLILICVLTATFTYTKIYADLRHHQTGVQDQPFQAQQNQGETPLNIARYRKTLSSSLWIQFTLLACYLPYCVVTALATFTGLTPPLVLGWRLTASVVFLNSSLNPFLYCWKIAEVRQAVKDTVKQLLCCSSS
ncbi:adenosine receptor A3-like [Oculina patagonica]